MQADQAMEEQGGMPPDGGLPPEGDIPPEADFDEPPEDEDFPPEEDEPADEEEEEEEDDEEPVRYQNAMPSGTNTCPPSYKGRSKMQRPTAPVQAPNPAQERRRMTKDHQRTVLARYERQNAQMARELSNMRLRFQRAEREKDLIQLESEGYMLDRVEELDHVADMPEAVYRKHLGMIRKRYQKAPLGRLAFDSESLRSATPQAGRSREQAQRIAEYAQHKGISFAAALEELEGETA
jgi:hypothetical protein